MRIIEIYKVYAVEGTMKIFGDANVKDRRHLKGDRFAGVVDGCEVYYNPNNVSRRLAVKAARMVIECEREKGG